MDWVWDIKQQYEWVSLQIIKSHLQLVCQVLHAKSNNI